MGDSLPSVSQQRVYFPTGLLVPWAGIIPLAAHRDGVRTGAELFQPIGFDGKNVPLT